MSSKDTFFEIIKSTPIGRIGRIHTIHGIIETPCFVFCGTHGSIKSMPTYNIKKTQLLLCNAFHLRNYVETIDKADGLHKFIGWKGPIITDSGGFQLMSMGYGSVSNEIKGVRSRKSHIQTINDEGCWFKNPINGDVEFFDVKRSMDIQCRIGVDIAVAFDECTVSSNTYEYTKQSMLMSYEWGKRSLEYFSKNRKPHQVLYLTIHGGTYKDLREASVEMTLNFANQMDSGLGEFREHDSTPLGIAFAGSLGRTSDEMYETVEYTMRLDKMRKNKRPVHLLGIGRIQDLQRLSKCNIDTFDCVEPTRIARHGTALIDAHKRINLNNACYKNDYRVIDELCGCDPCKLGFSRAYMHYLLKIREKSVFEMITEHNMHVMNSEMTRIRREIMEYQE
jgi:queuine tRNA-ribosyltransferase